jgi:hypothetical protein
MNDGYLLLFYRIYFVLTLSLSESGTEQTFLIWDGYVLRKIVVPFLGKHIWYLASYVCSASKVYFWCPAQDVMNTTGEI